MELHEKCVILACAVISILVKVAWIFGSSYKSHNISLESRVYMHLLHIIIGYSTVCPCIIIFLWPTRRHTKNIKDR